MYDTIIRVQLPDATIFRFITEIIKMAGYKQQMKEHRWHPLHIVIKYIVVSIATVLSLFQMYTNLSQYCLLSTSILFL